MDTGKKGKDQDTKRQTLTKGAEGTVLTLADDREYRLAPSNVNMVIEIEDEFGKSMTELIEDMTKTPSFKVLRHMAWVRAKRNHPDLTLEQMGELLTNEIVGKHTKEIIGNW